MTQTREIKIVEGILLFQFGLIVAKWIGLIEWSWWLVLLPIVLFFVVSIVLIVLFFSVVKELLERFVNWLKNRRN